jgi:hypothetical protein
MLYLQVYMNIWFEYLFLVQLYKSIDENFCQHSKCHITNLSD